MKTIAYLLNMKHVLSTSPFLSSQYYQLYFTWNPFFIYFTQKRFFLHHQLHHRTTINSFIHAHHHFNITHSILASPSLFFTPTPLFILHELNHENHSSCFTNMSSRYHQLVFLWEPLFLLIRWKFIRGGGSIGCRIDAIIGLFYKRALYKRQYSAKENSNLIDPDDSSHPITESILTIWSPLRYTNTIIYISHTQMSQNDRLFAERTRVLIYLLWAPSLIYHDLFNFNVTNSFSHENHHIISQTPQSWYGVATISMLLKIMCLLLQKSPIKETVFCKRDL